MSQGSQRRPASPARPWSGMSASKHDRQLACAPSGPSRGWAGTVGRASPPRLAELSSDGESNSAPGAKKEHHKGHANLYKESKILFGKINTELGPLHRDRQPCPKVWPPPWGWQTQTHCTTREGNPQHKFRARPTNSHKPHNLPDKTEKCQARGLHSVPVKGEQPQPAWAQEPC